MTNSASDSCEKVDNFGWPIRMIDGERACTRPCCKSEEFRIDGFCSIYCRDMYDEEQEVATLRAELAASQLACKCNHDEAVQIVAGLLALVKWLRVGPIQPSANDEHLIRCAERFCARTEANAERKEKEE